MKIVDSKVTFWFERQNSPKVYVDIFNEELKENFFEFNIIAVPSNINPIIPRLTTVSASNHSNLEISLVNACLSTKFDGLYHNDIENCVNYLQERVLKIFNTLKKCNINAFYTSIVVNIEEKNNDAVSYIVDRFFQPCQSEFLDEVGFKTSRIIDNTFYDNVSYNSVKQIHLNVSSKDKDLIIPLVSLNETDNVDRYLYISLEVNDKYAYDIDLNYKTNEQNLLRLFNLMKEKLEGEMK